MRIVIDTNVFISGIFFSGIPHQILKSWQNGKLQLVISKDIYNEYIRVADILSQKYSTINLDAFLNLLAFHAEIIEVNELLEPICEDPDDDKFVACALSGNVPIIVSGDKHLLKVSGYIGIHVLTPRKFVDDYLTIK